VPVENRLLIRGEKTFSVSNKPNSGRVLEKSDRAWQPEITRRISGPKCVAVRLVTSAAAILVEWAVIDEQRGQPTALAGRMAPHGAFKHPTDRGKGQLALFPTTNGTQGFQR
jgi:hypothetical protein